MVHTSVSAAGPRFTLCRAPLRPCHPIAYTFGACVRTFGCVGGRDTHGMDDDDRPPICPRCGVTMVPAALSADDAREGDWVCLECEELGEEE